MINVYRLARKADMEQKMPRQSQVLWAVAKDLGGVVLFVGSVIVITALPTLMAWLAELWSQG